MARDLTIQDDLPDTFEVRSYWWGREEYLANGVLLKRQWNLSLRTDETFEVGRNVVRIELRVFGEYAGRAYVNGQVRVHELFPQLTRKREPIDRRQILRNFAVWFLLGVTVTAIYLSKR